MSKSVVTATERMAWTAYLLLVLLACLYGVAEFSELWTSWGPAMLVVPAAMVLIAQRGLILLLKRPWK